MTPQELENLAHLRRARDLIDRDYAQPLDVPTMAQKALMSPAHFSRQFRAAYGETPYSYLMTRRIERAMALLRAGMSVTDACMAVGCTSLGSFSSRFTEIVGESPDGLPAARARGGQGDAHLRGQDAHAAGTRRIEQDRRSLGRGRVLTSSSMTISLQYTNVTVNDVDEAIAFYGDALGLKVQNDVSSGEHRWVTLGTDAQPGLGIVLSDPHAGRSQADGDVMQELLTKGVLPMLVFSTDDLDATFETLRSSGAEVLQEPIQQDWGPRDCAFRDPSGNMVRINQASVTPAPGSAKVRRPYSIHAPR